MYSDKLKKVLTLYDPENKKYLKKDGKILIDEETNFLPDEVNHKERIWYVNNDIHEQVRCPICDSLSKVRWIKRKSSNGSFRILLNPRICIIMGLEKYTIVVIKYGF